MSDPTHNPIPEPIYADRASGEKFADAVAMVNAYLARYAVEVVNVRVAPKSCRQLGPTLPSVVPSLE